MVLRYVKHETGDYTYDTETKQWTKLNNDKKGPKEKEEETDIQSKMFQKPTGFSAELSPNPWYWRLGRRG